jgi:hypothetical protein
MRDGYRLIYFLGAGAAKACGYPTTPDLYREMRTERADMGFFKDFGNHLDAIVGGRQLDIETLYSLALSDVSAAVEELYGSASQDTLLDKLLLDLVRKHANLKDRFSALQETFNMAKEEILDFIIEKFWTVHPDLEPYGGLRIQSAFWELGALNVEVFTTNYDTCLEQSLDDYVPYTKGVVSDRFEIQELLPERPDKVRVIKLHGSLDLYELEDGRIMRIDSRMKPGKWKGDLRIVRPYLVPPEEGKVEYDDRQESLLKIFERDIKKANALAIVGSSMRDVRLSEILSTAPADCQVLVACGSKSTEIADRWFSKQSKVDPVEEHFPNPKIEDWLTVQIALKGKWPEP